MSINQVKLIPTPSFSTMDSRVTLHDLELNQNDDDDSNTSDEFFLPDEEFKKEFNNELKLNKELSD